MDFSILINIDKTNELVFATINNDKIDLKNSYELEVTLSNLAQIYDIIIDFKNTLSISSSGIGALVNIYKISDKKNKSIKLININENIRIVFQISKLDKFFNLDNL